MTDGQPHNISLDVVSAEDDHTINQNWFVSGLLQVVTDPSGKPTTGKITRYDAPLFAETDTTGSVGVRARGHSPRAGEPRNRISVLNGAQRISLGVIRVYLVKIASKHRHLDRSTSQRSSVRI